jgi:ribosomal-protein-alanine N-acetyltransferase
VSAVLSLEPRLRPMLTEDVDPVIDIERTIYEHPWTPGNFRDSLQAGYSCWMLECGPELAGYGVLMMGVDEAHLLNISVAAPWQRRGLGRHLLQHFIGIAREAQAGTIFLEVRPTNAAARALYKDTGFRELYVRAGYYPAKHGREDAILMGLEL